MKSDRKRTILFIIILLILSMGIGYAFLTTTLTIDGVSDIDSASWDIHWENISISPSSTLPSDQIISSPTISGDGKTINFHIKLKQPGDYFSFEMDAVNSGTLNAIVESISYTVNGNDFNLPYINTSLYCADDRANVIVGSSLPAGTRKKYDYYISYNPDVSVYDLPTENKSLLVSIKVTYSQYITGISPYNNQYVYTSDLNNSFNIGSPLPYGAVYYDNSSSALNFDNGYMIFRHYIEDNIIATTDLGFFINDNIYYIRGGDGGESYNSNKLTLQNAFSSDGRCEEDVEDGVTWFNCYSSSYNILVYNNGNIISDRGAYNTCTIEENGTSSCEARTG